MGHVWRSEDNLQKLNVHLLPGESQESNSGHLACSSLCPISQLFPVLARYAGYAGERLRVATFPFL